MVWRDAQIPEVYRGLIVGKGADKLKKLQVEFNVRIQVPRGKKEGPVIVEGTKEDVEACIEEMHSVIENHSRSAQRTHSKGKGTKGGKGKGKGKAKSQAPATCFLCNTEVTSLSQAAQHLRGQKHRMRVVEERPEFAELFEREHFVLADLEEVLLEPEIAEFHRELNFKVDEILSAIPAMQLKAEKMEEVNDEIAMFVEDPKWLEIKSRVVVHWDDTREAGCKTHGLTKAPDLREMLTRCSLKDPPRVKIPKFPAPLPHVKTASFASNSLRAAHKYPASPGSCRLGIAIMKMPMMGIDLSDYDFVCGTSFIKALAGDAEGIKDTYYIQHFGRTACVLHVPSAYHGQNDAGHAVEMLLCGDSLPGFFAAGTAVAINGRTFFVVSEVDATDSNSSLVEIKSSKTEQIVKHSAVLQIALNGSEHILGCKLDDDQTRLLSVKWFSAEKIQMDHAKSFTEAGQHVRYMLGKVSDFLKEHDTDTEHEQMEQVVWKVTFDASNGKLPSFEIATDVEVLPTGLE